MKLNENQKNQAILVALHRRGDGVETRDTEETLAVFHPDNTEQAYEYVNEVRRDMAQYLINEFGYDLIRAQAEARYIVVYKTVPFVDAIKVT